MFVAFYKKKIGNNREQSKAVWFIIRSERRENANREITDWRIQLFNNMGFNFRFSGRRRKTPFHYLYCYLALDIALQIPQQCLL